jgi:fucose permease
MSKLNRYGATVTALLCCITALIGGLGWASLWMLPVGFYAGYANGIIWDTIFEWFGYKVDHDEE